MTSPALLMLLERLLWPVPRVRWEAGRSLAHLIREKDRETADGLLKWISARRLESEVILGLGVIDAFDLSNYFKSSEVSEAVQVPSLLSDFLLKKNYSNVAGLSPFRYAVSPLEPATLHPLQEAWFDRYRKWAVPKVFTIELTQLQQQTFFPFLMRWEHDWRWLQATNPRPVADYPHYFSGGDRSRVGQFDHGQRELYVSAYLRTLAYAFITGSISHEVAEHYALLALTMNRGLADLEPITRPDWAQNLLPCDAVRTKDVAQKLWSCAEDTARSGEVPVAFRVVDFDTDNFIEFDTTLAIGAPGFIAGPAEVKELDTLIMNERPGEMAGVVDQDSGPDPRFTECPLSLTQGVIQDFIGRAHIDIACNLRLASPYLFETPARIQCSPSEIFFEAGGNVLTRWVHWYADWGPAMFRELESTIGSMSTVLKSSLDKLCASGDVEVARLVRVRRGTRQAIYDKHEVEIESFWA